MSRPSSRRLVPAALGAALALAAAAAPAAAQDPPIAGFTAAGAERQQAYEDAFTRGVSAEDIARTSRRLSDRPQLIGTPGVRRSQQISVDKLRSYGLDVSTPGYTVLATRPEQIQVTMTAPYRRTLATRERGFPWQEHFEDVIPGYNAYSPPGDVSGEVVYANYGLPKDYAALDDLGVSVAGKIVLVRYGGSFRGVKAQQAELRGAKGLIIYSDPADDGFKRGPVYPDGPWRPADAIQRGSIQYIFNYPGDPLTPGVPSVPGTRRLPRDRAGNLPKIPTTPISYGEAQPLLESLTGPGGAGGLQGRAADHLPRRAGRDAGPAGPRHRLRADAGVERHRHDPRHHEAGREGRHRRALRRLDLRHERQHQRLDLDHAGRPQPRPAARPRLAAGADDRARGLGRRGVRAARLDRVGGAVPGGPAPQRRRLRQPRRRRRDRVQRRRRARSSTTRSSR